MEKTTEKKYGVCLEYYNGILNEDERVLYENQLKNTDIVSFYRDKTGEITNCVEELSSHIRLLLSNPLVHACMTGILTNASYDLLKSYILWIWKSVKGQKITKVTSSKILQEDTKFSIHISINEHTNIDFKLDGNISDEQKDKCIDNVFEFAKEIPLKSKPSIGDFAVYDSEKEKWTLVDIQDIIQKKINKKNNRK